MPWDKALAYAVFLWELLRSKEAHSDDWYHLFGFKTNIVPSAMTIQCVVAMPDIIDANFLGGYMVCLGNDRITLHCICLDSEAGKVVRCSDGF